MRFKNIVPEACHICGKQTFLAAIEPHPTHPEVELHTFRCEDCGASQNRFPSQAGIAASG
jgi:hypothetical protein